MCSCKFAAYFQTLRTPLEGSLFLRFSYEVFEYYKGTCCLKHANLIKARDCYLQVRIASESIPWNNFCDSFAWKAIFESLRLEFPKVVLKNFQKYLAMKLIQAVTRRCFIKKVFLKTSQNSQENTSFGGSLLLKKRPLYRRFPMQEFFRTFFYRTPPGLLLNFPHYT